MANDKTGSGGEAGDDRDVYKPGRAAPLTERAHRNMTDLMVGVSRAMAEAAQTFSTTLRDRAKDAARPTDVVEAGALSASRMFEVLAESWKGFYDNLVRDHSAKTDPIDYDRLATLVAEKLRASEPKP
ncbi:MAG: hypothetical protein E6J90_11065 [Deltaproteobacteria bacterium]|nr:MAG: hypothetical protein E6J91_11130 [Deltaproteobacteria bacterium]TMQ23199.1 MAG: hypothetical protein E6J90_11065 [Deltaproteobacteria bacterium]